MTRRVAFGISNRTDGIAAALERATAASSPAPVSDCLTRLRAALPRLTQRRDRHGGVWIDQAELLAWIEGEMNP